MHDHDRGLDHDLPRLVNRRRALGLIGGGLGSALLAACGGGGDARPTATTTDASGQIPEETAGPFPGTDVLTESGVVREDITTSFGDFAGVADGVPTRLEMTLLDVAGGGSPLAGAAVYVWHCDRAARYSLYDEGVTEENYLRGVQESDADGKLAFTTIFPAAYAGRWPHVHFEVYESLDAAGAEAGVKLRTSQLAIPEDICNAVYATAGYEQSATKVAQVSLESDLVFADGYASQLAKASGDVESSITLTLNVGV